MLEQLREQTRLAHLTLEVHPFLQRLLSDQLTETEYAQLLQAMLVFYQSLERELVPATSALLEQYPGSDYRYLPRVPLLSNDCQALGHASSGFTHPSIELGLDVSTAHLPGVLYVIEGSTQGGRFIARHLADTLGVSEKSGASFFNMHRSVDSWTAFRRWVGRDLAHRYQEDIKSVIEGADMTFSALHNHLDQWQLVIHE